MSLINPLYEVKAMAFPDDPFPPTQTFFANTYDYWYPYVQGSLYYEVIVKVVFNLPMVDSNFYLNYIADIRTPSPMDEHTVDEQMANRALTALIKAYICPYVGLAGKQQASAYAWRHHNCTLALRRFDLFCDWAENNHHMIVQGGN